MSGVSSADHTMPNFLSQINDISREIAQGNWNGREDAVADRVLHLFRANVSLLGEEPHKLQNPNFTATVIQLVDSLNELGTKTQKVDMAIKRLTNLLQDECNGPGSLDDLKTMPSDNQDQIRSTVTEFKELIRQNVPGAKEGFADWFLYNGVSLSKVDLSKEELFEIAPYMRYLNIDTEKYSESEIQELLGKCERLQVLKLSTDAITKTPKLPESVKSFDCSFCQNLKEVSHLNSQLMAFKTIGCEILERLPEEFPGKLEVCTISQSFVKSLPKLNEGLTRLDCSQNDYLASIPRPLPSTLQTFELRNCPKLSEVPDPLPGKLKTFIARESGLAHLPKMPASIKEVDISWCSDLKVPDDYKDTLPPDVKYSH